MKSKYEQRSPRGPIPTPLWDRGTTAVMNGKKWTWHEITAYSFFRKHTGGVVGENALSAIRMVRAERDADDYGLVVRWRYDDMEIDWMTDSSSAVNRCRYEHNGRHVTAIEKDGSGQLDDECPYARRIELWFACVVRLCNQCLETTGDVDYSCEQCKMLNNLGGIDTPDRDYWREIEAELVAEALDMVRDREAAEMAVCRARGNEYLGRGL